MFFEIKPYQSNSVMLTATSIDDIPVDDLDDMYFDGMQFFIDGKSVTPEQIRMRIRTIRADAAWAAEEAIPVKTEESEQKQMDSLDLEKMLMTEESVKDETAKETSSEIELIPESNPGANIEAEIEQAIADAEGNVEEPQAETVSEELIRKNSEPGIYIDDGINDTQIYPTIAAASRNLNIPSYKISDAIKQGKELNGLKIYKVE